MGHAREGRSTFTIYLVYHGGGGGGVGGCGGTGGWWYILIISEQFNNIGTDFM